VRVLIAPDKFKGSLSATQVADNIATGFAGVDADVATLPMADGGDGSVAAAVAAGMPSHECTVADALGRPTTAIIAFDGTVAVVEVAATCGLSTLPSGILAPMTASSYGFGQAIRYAIGLGARRLVLALGGSASTDGGAGMLAALGYTFADADGRQVEPSAAVLHHIHSVSADDAVDLRGVELVVATDVTSPLLGPDGAAMMFGPQKGASAADIEHLETGLRQLVSGIERTGWPGAGRWAVTPGAGSAGGIGFAALMVGGRVVSGADYFLDLLDFDGRAHGADLVITGEGRLDDQTLTGKLPVVVARRAAPTPVVAVVGLNSMTARTRLFSQIYAVAELSQDDTADDPVRTAALLREIGADIGRRHAVSTQPAVTSG